MATFDLGRVTPIYRREYSATASYELNDVVLYEGNLYWHVQATATVGIAPTDTTVWKLAFSDEGVRAEIRGYADDAQVSKTAAAQSASQASASASNASASASQAASSAQTASTKASEASTKASEASTSAQTASTKASEATASAQSAASSAQTATDKATFATNKAQAASESATLATAKANAAATSETNAVTAAQTATAKASEAAASATSAQEYDESAQASAVNAQTAQTAAETAQTAAETAQGLAEDARDEAQQIKDDVEDAIADKADSAEIGDLSQLTTTAKNSLVSAINETNERLNDANSFYDEELGIEFRPLEGAASSSSTPYEQIHILDLPLVAGKTYKIDWSIPAEISPYVVYCFLSDGNGNNLIQSRIAAGDTTKTDTYTASANNNDSYLYFTVGNVQVTVSASVTMTNADPTRIDELETAVDALEDTTAKKVESRSVEITNPDTGHYINKNGGYSASKPFSISQAFDVYAGETIEVVATGYLNETAIIAQVKSEYPYTVLARSRSSAEETYTYTALENMSVVVSYDNRKPCIIVVKKIYDLTVIPQMQAELRDAKWKYAFDRICCIGDSLTSGAYYAGTWGGASIEQNYPAILSRMLNTPVKNSGRSGASAKTWYTNNMAGLTLSDYGTFVIWLGTNQGLTDTISTDVDPYDDYNDFADTNTGYLCRTICQIKEAVPDAHIMICTVFSTSGDLATTNDIINQVASKYALQLVDNSDLDNTNYPLYHSNAVHFNKAGNIFVADRIKNAMVSYVAPDGRNAEFGLTARTD